MGEQEIKVVHSFPMVFASTLLDFPYKICGVMLLFLYVFLFFFVTFIVIIVVYFLTYCKFLHEILVFGKVPMLLEFDYCMSI